MNYALTDKEKLAWKFASEKHKGQIRRFTDQPYFDAHVRNVNGIVKQITTNEDILCASILHDVCEDCGVTYQEILKEFGKIVADLVKELTSDEDEIERIGKAKYLTNKMLNMSDDALIIKLADRLQNMSDARTASDSFRKKYFNQTTFILDNLENKRRLNKKHRNLISQIRGILDRIKKGYKKIDTNPMAHLENFSIFAIHKIK